MWESATHAGRGRTWGRKTWNRKTKSCRTSTVVRIRLTRLQPSVVEDAQLTKRIESLGNLNDRANLFDSVRSASSRNTCGGSVARKVATRFSSDSNDPSDGINCSRASRRTLSAVAPGGAPHR